MLTISKLAFVSYPCKLLHALFLEIPKEKKPSFLQPVVFKDRNCKEKVFTLNTLKVIHANEVQLYLLLENYL